MNYAAGLPQEIRGRATVWCASPSGGYVLVRKREEPGASVENHRSAELTSDKLDLT